MIDRPDGAHSNTTPQQSETQMTTKLDSKVQPTADELDEKPQSTSSQPTETQMTKRPNHLIRPAHDVGFDPTAGLRAYLGEPNVRELSLMENLRSRYVTSARDDEIKLQIDRLVRNAAARKYPGQPHGADNRRAGIGFAVIGESGAGKSTAMEKAFAEHPLFSGLGVLGSGCPLLSIGAPSPSTLGQLAIEILHALGYRTDRSLPENKAWRRARFHLEENRVMFLHIDDAQHVLHTASEYDIQRFSDTLKNIMIDRRWPVQLILSGLPDLVPFVQRDRQLKRRLKYVELGSISPQQDAAMIEGVLNQFSEKAGLRLIVSPEDMLIGRLAHAGAYMLGLIVEILLDAIEYAVSGGRDSLTIEDFADAYTDRALEPSMNVFLSSTWASIDTGHIRKTSLPPDEVKPTGKARGRRR